MPNDTLEQCADFEGRVKLPAGGPLLAAVSGGADSTAMLVALQSLLDRAAGGSGGKTALYCVHINHNLRGEEAVQDAQYTKELCGKLAVPFKLFTIPAGEIHQQAARKGCGVEAAAREARHAIFREEAARLGARRILIAHTRDDLLETILFRLLRGSAPAGLSPMKQDTGTIFRPLLGLSRAEILRYLEVKKIPFRNDSTNNDVRFTRNRIRHTLIPVLTRHFPGWEAELLFFADTQGRTASHLANIASAHVTLMGKKSAYIAGFASLEEIAVEEAVYCAVNRLDVEAAEDTSPSVPAVRHGCRLTKARPQALMSICNIITRQIDKLKNRQGWRFLSSARDRSGMWPRSGHIGADSPVFSGEARKNAPLFGIPASKYAQDSGCGLCGQLPPVDFIGERKRGIRRRALRDWLESGKKKADIGAYTLERDDLGGITVLRKITDSEEGYALSLMSNKGHKGRVVFYSSRFL